LNKPDFDNITHGQPAYYLTAPNGVSNISAPNAITQGSPVPILLSQPHFFQADPSYTEQVKILPPNDKIIEAEHNTYLWVEPYTGITIQAQKRLQVNLEIQGSFFLYPKMPKYYVPVVWFEQSATITNALADEWHNTVGVVTSLLLAIPILGYSLAGLMVFLSGSVFVLAYNRRYNHPDGYTSINQSQKIQ